MTSRSKAKGSTAERQVVDYLRATGWPHAERRLAGATKDRGDIAGVVGVCIEVKSQAELRLSTWVDEALAEQANDRADIGLVWHKRRGKGSPADWYVTITGAQLVQLLAAAGYAPTPRQPATGESP